MAFFITKSRQQIETLNNGNNWEIEKWKLETKKKRKWKNGKLKNGTHWNHEKMEH